MSFRFPGEYLCVTTEQHWEPTGDLSWPRRDSFCLTIDKDELLRHVMRRLLLYLNKTVYRFYPLLHD